LEGTAEVRGLEGGEIIDLDHLFKDCGEGKEKTDDQGVGED